MKEREREREREGRSVTAIAHLGPDISVACAMRTKVDSKAKLLVKKRRRRLCVCDSKIVLEVYSLLSVRGEYCVGRLNDAHGRREDAAGVKLLPRVRMNAAR